MRWELITKEVEKAKAMVLKTEDAISKVELKWS